MCDIALAALAGREIVFEIAVAGADCDGPERGAAQVGVQHDSGRIDDAPDVKGCGPSSRQVDDVHHLGNGFGRAHRARI